jgi:hypothetical protein
MTKNVDRCRDRLLDSSSMYTFTSIYEREKKKNKTRSINAIGGTLVTQCHYKVIHHKFGAGARGQRERKDKNVCAKSVTSISHVNKTTY